MNFTKSLGLILVGMLIGALAGGAAHAQLLAPRQPARISMIDVNSALGTARLVFIKDSTSSGCWIGAFTASGDGGPAIALAPAPGEACQ